MLFDATTKKHSSGFILNEAAETLCGGFVGFSVFDNIFVFMKG